jgi:hypothetical protein
MRACRANSQSKAGIPTLCIALLLVALKLPNSRPWKAEVNDNMDIFGEPGSWLFIQLDSSSGEIVISAGMAPACLAE